MAPALFAGDRVHAVLGSFMLPSVLSKIERNVFKCWSAFLTMLSEEAHHHHFVVDYRIIFRAFQGNGRLYRNPTTTRIKLLQTHFTMKNANVSIAGFNIGSSLINNAFSMSLSAESRIGEYP